MSLIPSPPSDASSAASEIDGLIQALNAEGNPSDYKDAENRQFQYWRRRIVVLRREACRASILDRELKVARSQIATSEAESARLEQSLRAEEELKRIVETQRADLEYELAEKLKGAEAEIGGQKRHAANLEELIEAGRARSDQLLRQIEEMQSSLAWKLTQVCSRFLRRMRSIFRGTTRARS